MNYEIEMNKNDVGLLALIIFCCTNVMVASSNTALASLNIKLTNKFDFTTYHPECEKYFGKLPYRKILILDF